MQMLADVGTQNTVGQVLLVMMMLMMKAIITAVEVVVQILW